MIKEYCDRCTKKISENEDSSILMTKSEGEHPNPVGTVCEDCWNSFDAWWERKG
jgi:hypothetical protein